MDPKLRVIAVAGSVLVLAFVVELVRRRQLKEEYSLLWVLTAVGLVLLSIWDGLLNEVSDLIGAAAPQSTLFFFGLTFVVLMLLHFSVRISALERRITSLVQELGLLGLSGRPLPDPQATPPAEASGDELEEPLHGPVP